MTTGRTIGATQLQAEPGADVLDAAHAFLAAHVAFPSPESADAVTLWAAHCHLVACFESTPRLALLSPEKQSGKTRTLEVLRLARGHEKVPAGGQVRSPLVANKSPRAWPRKVPAPH